MPTLTRHKDALGKPLSSAELYMPVQPFSAAVDGDPLTFNRDMRLPGNHPAVTVNPANWIPASTDTFTAQRLYLETVYGAKPQAHEPFARVPGPIPPERRMVAKTSYHDRSGRAFDVGSIGDANDPFVKANPELFEKEKK